jgi:hypothetical protein
MIYFIIFLIKIDLIETLAFLIEIARLQKF